MNIILQHFAGELRELDKLSQKSMQDYAVLVGADYELIRDFPFRKHLTAPCQKVFMLDSHFDKYDQVLMVDIDMFTTCGLKDNIFDVDIGVGLFSDVQRKLKDRLVKERRINSDDPYWGGAIYKMNLAMRKKLRSAMPETDEWMNFYNKQYHFEDEGIIAELAHRAKVRAPNLNQRWCQCSFLPKHKPGFIHIRTKITPSGPKRDKIENYRSLVKSGLI